MKQKTIKKILNKKITEWTDTIKDEGVKKLVKKNTIVTGGSIASMLLDEKVNDFDVYFRDIETVKAVSEYYVKSSAAPVEILDGRKLNPVDYADTDNNAEFKVACREIAGQERIKIYHPSGYYCTKGNREHVLDQDELQEQSVYTQIKDSEQAQTEHYSPIYFTANAITLTDDIQMVIRFFGEAKDLHKNYDFVHATSYYDYKNDELVVPYEALESLRTRELQYIGSLYPLTSVIRTQKFIKRGWRCSAGTYLKILYQVSQLNLNDVNVLSQQLQGVDVILFGLVIDALNNRDKSVHENITYEYLCAIIDKVFG